MHETAVRPAPAKAPEKLAHPLHTIVFLALVAALAYEAVIRAAQLSATPPPDRVYLYLRTIASEWFILAFVLGGVHWYGVSVWSVLGKRWHSVREVLRDVGIGFAFWLVSLVVTSALGAHDQAGGNRDIAYLLPGNGLEMLLWVGVSVSAGICEEAVYRGYLQKQFAALTKNALLGIVFSATMFAGVHAYQGWRRAAVIGVGAVLSGWLTHWRRSVRPAMIAHAWQDSIAPVLVKLVDR